MKTIIFQVLLYSILLIGCKSDDDNDKPNSDLVTFTDRNIDVNNDGENDFIITVNHIKPDIEGATVSESFIVIVPQGNNKLLYTDSKGYLPMQIGDSILFPDSDSTKWFNFSGDLFGFNYTNGEGKWFGPWFEVQNGFLPVKIELNDEEYCGWMQLRFETNNLSCTLEILNSFISPTAELSIKI
jgi:hypothetical protein